MYVFFSLHLLKKVFQTCHLAITFDRRLSDTYNYRTTCDTHIESTSGGDESPEHRKGNIRS